MPLPLQAVQHQDRRRAMPSARIIVGFNVSPPSAGSSCRGTPTRASELTRRLLTQHGVPCQPSSSQSEDCGSETEDEDLFTDSDSEDEPQHSQPGVSAPVRMPQPRWDVIRGLSGV